MSAEDIVFLVGAFCGYLPSSDMTEGSSSILPRPVCETDYSMTRLDTINVIQAISELWRCMHESFVAAVDLEVVSRFGAFGVRAG